MNTIAKHFIDALKPKRRPGGLPKITPCPYCGVQMSQTDHSKHRPPCAAEFAQDPGGGYNRDGTFPQT